MKILPIVLSLILIAGCSPKPDIFNTKYSGTLELTEHVLGAKSAGRVATLTVMEGDHVKKGQLLATLDRQQQARKDLERIRELFKSGGTNEQAVELAKLALDDQEIVAPVNGVVLLKAAEIGETVPAGSGVVVVGDIAQQWIKVFLPEGLIGQLKMGQKATVKFDGLKSPYDGHVSFIATKAEFTPRNVQSAEERVTQVFAVKVTLDKPDDHIHPGVSADVEFVQ